MLLLLTGCIFVVDDDDREPDLRTCDDIVAAVDDESREIRACTAPEQCGQELHGTSCGCTRNLVARTDADTERFYRLLGLAEDESCDVGMDSTCDCPEADGFDCVDGYCAWNYVTGSETLAACDGDTGDTFDVTSVAIDGDLLNVGVAYAGGCQTHEWTLCWPDQVFMESDPVQASLEILHDAHGDSCEAWIEETIQLDLSPLASAWQGAYGASSGTIVVHVAGQSVVYDF